MRINVYYDNGMMDNFDTCNFTNAEPFRAEGRNIATEIQLRMDLIRDKEKGYAAKAQLMEERKTLLDHITALEDEASLLDQEVLQNDTMLEEQALEDMIAQATILGNEITDTPDEELDPAVAAFMAMEEPATNEAFPVQAVSHPQLQLQRVKERIEQERKRLNEIDALLQEGSLDIRSGEGLVLDLFWYDMNTTGGTTYAELPELNTQIPCAARSLGTRIRLVSPNELLHIVKITCDGELLCWKQGGELIDAVKFSNQEILCFSNGSTQSINDKAVAIFNYLKRAYPHAEDEDIALSMGYPLEAYRRIEAEQVANSEEDEAESEPENMDDDYMQFEEPDFSDEGNFPGGAA